MSQLAVFFLAGYVGQALSDVLFGIIFWRFHRAYRHDYLRLWSLSWMALGAYHLCATLSAILYRFQEADEPARILISMAAQVSGYSHAVLLVAATVELIRSRVAPRWMWTRVLPAVIAFACSLTWVTIDAPIETRLFVRVGLRSLAAAAAFLFIAAAFLRSSDRGVGRPVVIAASSLYAAENLHYFGIDLARLFAGFDAGYAVYLSFADILLQTALCLGMAIWLLERERRAAMEATRQLKESQAQLLHSQKMEAVGQLAGGIAHDFNNSLMGILGYAEMIESESSAPPSARRHAASIRRAAERSAALTRQLLAFSRRQVVAHSVFDVNGLIRELADMIQRLLDARIRLDLDLAPESAWIRADRAQMEQVFLNLAVNARDAMPDGGRLRIETGVHDETHGAPRGVIIRVSDTGVGMDEETRRRAFDPFFTAKSPDRGTGLGLSTVYGTIRQAGGEIEIRSAPGEGTTVVMRMPRLEPPIPAWTEAPSPPDPLAKTRILVVEDDDSVRRLVGEILSREGHAVLLAADGDEALRLVRSEPPLDVLLTDLVLPGRDGIEVALDLRRSHPAPAVVVMSGHPTARSVEHARRRLRAEVLSKPVAREELIRAVGRAIARARGRNPSGG